MIAQGEEGLKCTNRVMTSTLDASDMGKAVQVETLQSGDK